jgi:hypothetical protein
MQPVEWIKQLDRQLATKGETATLRRRVGTTAVFVEVQVRVRLSGYRAEELVGAVKQTDSAFVMSPTEISAASATWPGAAGGGAMPKIGDFLKSAGGGDRKIEAIQPVRIGDVIVRYEGRILG